MSEVDDFLEMTFTCDECKKEYPLKNGWINTEKGDKYCQVCGYWIQIKDHTVENKLKLIWYTLCKVEEKIDCFKDEIYRKIDNLEEKIKKINTPKKVWDKHEPKIG